MDSAKSPAKNADGKLRALVRGSTPAQRPAPPPRTVGGGQTHRARIGLEDLDLCGLAQQARAPSLTLARTLALALARTRTLTQTLALALTLTRIRNLALALALTLTLAPVLFSQPSPSPQTYPFPYAYPYPSQPQVAPGRRTVLVAKHLCGVATDYALNLTLTLTLTLPLT